MFVFPSLPLALQCMLKHHPPHHPVHPFKTSAAQAAIRRRPWRLWCHAPRRPHRRTERVPTFGWKSCDVTTKGGWKSCFLDQGMAPASPCGHACCVASFLLSKLQDWRTPAQDWDRTGATLHLQVYKAILFSVSCAGLAFGGCILDRCYIQVIQCIQQ